VPPGLPLTEEAVSCSRSAVPPHPCETRLRRDQPPVYNLESLIVLRIGQTISPSGISQNEIREDAF